MNDVGIGPAAAEVAVETLANFFFGRFRFGIQKRPHAGFGRVERGDARLLQYLPPLAAKNFAPRVGFAYDLSGKQTTVIRGGYGIFFSPIVGGGGNPLNWSRAPDAKAQAHRDRNRDREKV